MFIWPVTLETIRMTRVTFWKKMLRCLSLRRGQKQQQQKDHHHTEVKSRRAFSIYLNNKKENPLSRSLFYFKL